MLEEIAKLSEQQRKAIFMEASTIRKMHAEMIEKDFWVCWTLNRIFNDEYLKKILCFKGGTSLSKAFHLIERFSEDIDLILDWNIIKQGKDIEQKNKTQQDKRNKELLQESQVFISTILKNKIEAVVNDICSVTIDETDKNNLKVEYPKGISGNYILPFIKLEIGPLAAWMPNDTYPIKPYIDGISPTINIENIIVPTIKAERTFWEKATILHREHFRTKGDPERYSRHYYDLYKMGNSKVKQEALANKSLLKAVVEFKKTFYPSAWANYDQANIGTLKLLPTAENRKYLEADYKKMQGMIFGDYPSFEDIVEFLQNLEQEINNI